MPCTPKRARKLLAAGRARAHLRFPFAIRLTDRTAEDSQFQPLNLKIDPGSVTSGIAVCRVAESVDADGELQSNSGTVTSPAVVEPVVHIVFLMELVHRGRAIKAALQSRAAQRRRRRSANLRYRAPRFNNRTRPEGWLPPSLRHRIDTTITWVARLRRLAPITVLAQELVRFDMQLMQDAEVSGVDYQRGTLAGYEAREYLLEKCQRTCSYCDATGVPLQVEHVHPKAKGGTNRISNLTLACEPCNIKKGARDIKEFLAKDPAHLARVLTQLKTPLRDAAAVNATRWALLKTLEVTGLPVETGSGGQTKWNCGRLGIVKTHALDAACVGAVGAVRGAVMPTLRVTCTGRGSRCKTRLNKYGFPRAYLTRQKSAFGFRTGDMVIATVLKGKNKGVHRGRVAIRRTGSFNIQTGIEGAATVQGISHKHCHLVQRADGYGYAWHKTQTQPSKEKPMANPEASRKKASKSTQTSKAATAARSAPFLPALKDGVSRGKI